VQNNTYLFDNKPYLVINYGDNDISIENINLNGPYAFYNNKTLYEEYTDGIDILMTEEEISNITEEDVPNVRLYYCNQNKCNLSSGFLIYKSKDSYKTAKCSFDFCGFYDDLCYSTDKKVLLNKKTLFCVKPYNFDINSYEVIENSKNYIFNYSKSDYYFNLYESNISANIFVQTTISTNLYIYNIYRCYNIHCFIQLTIKIWIYKYIYLINFLFLFLLGGYYLYKDVFKKRIKRMICKGKPIGSTCLISDDLGYYTYTPSTKNNEFIYCESDKKIVF